jgi:hypothetical protein
MVMFFVMAGLGVVFTVQILIFFVAIKNSLPKAMICLVIPGYVYVYAKKDPQAKVFLWGWYLGILLMVVGVVASA